MAIFSRHPLSQAEVSGTPYIKLAQSVFNSGTLTHGRPGYLIHEVPSGVQDTIFLSISPAAYNVGSHNTTVYVSGVGDDPILSDAAGTAKYYQQDSSSSSARTILINGELTMQGGEALYAHNRWSSPSSDGTVLAWGYVNRITP